MLLLLSVVVVVVFVVQLQVASNLNSSNGHSKTLSIAGSFDVLFFVVVVVLFMLSWLIVQIGIVLKS
jgi:hypothetical protein